MATSLVWAQVGRPRVPLVYLDLNHFILLARARKGAAPRGYAELLEAALAASSDGRVIFALSGEHLQELYEVRDPRQRRDVAEVMEALSGFGYLLGRPTVAQLEVEAGFRAIYGEHQEMIPVPLIGPSFARAFGMVGGLRIEDESGQNVTQSTRSEMGPAFDNTLREANLELERRMLRGPSDDELAGLRTDPEYRPEVARDSQLSRLAFELAFSDVLDAQPTLRRGRLRDFVAFREVSHEWLDIINQVQRDRAQARLPVPDPDDDEPMKTLISAMPHTQVAVSIKTRYHRNPTHPWTINDIFDIDALSVAYAYCDVAFTDHALRSALADTPELRTITTFLPDKPAQLTEWLEAQPDLPGVNLWLGGARLT